MNDMSLMIFAAGFGTRMGELTKELPKPMLPLNGKPIVDRAIEVGRNAGVRNIVSNVHYLEDQIRPHLVSHQVAVISEKPDILDTGGGLKAARHLLTSPTFTLNPDALWSGPNPLSVLERAWKQQFEALLLLVPLQRAVNREGPGDFELKGGQLKRGGDYVYTGAQIIRMETLDSETLPAFSLNRVWDKIAEKGALGGAIYPGEWIDIGTAENLAAAEEMTK